MFDKLKNIGRNNPIDGAQKQIENGARNQEKLGDDRAGNIPKESTRHGKYYLLKNKIK